MTAPNTGDLARHLIVTADADPAQAETLARIVGDRLRWSGDGAPPMVLDAFGQPMVDDSGNPVTGDALISLFKAEMPSLFRPATPVATTPVPPSTNLTERARAEHQARQAPPAAGEVNPYSRATWNLTQQVLMQQRNPALAARLKAEAGA